MFRYKGFMIWSNQLQGWCISEAGYFVGAYKTQGAAKAVCTRMLKARDAAITEEAQHGQD